MAWKNRKDARSAAVKELDSPSTLAEQAVKRLGLRRSAAPNAVRHNSDVGYLRLLVSTTGLTQAEISKRLGVSVRTLERHLSYKRRASLVPNYLLQYGLEKLAIRRAELNRTAREKAATVAGSIGK